MKLWSSKRLCTNTIEAMKVLIKSSAKKRHWQMFFRLYENARKYCDPTISVGCETFHAHKVILASRSTVFEAMLDNKMREGISNEIVIEEMKPEVFREMLYYIYYNKVSDLSKATLDLYLAANMRTIFCTFEKFANLKWSNA